MPVQSDCTNVVPANVRTHQCKRGRCEWVVQPISQCEFVGADGCHCGWFSVGFKSNGEYELRAFCSFEDLLACYQAANLILVDIPIGLPEGPGGRDCDREARRRLCYPRAASVFPTPTRQTVQKVPPLPKEHDFPAAVCAEIASSGEWLDLPTFWIARKIAEVDNALRARGTGKQPRVREVHPELCFWALHEKNPMEHNKNAREQKGVEERIKVLKSVEPRARNIYDAGCSKFFRKCVDRDDIVDALVAAVTARKGWPNDFQTLPVNPPVDERELPMEMVFWEPP